MARPSFSQDAQNIVQFPGEKCAHSSVHWDRLSEQELHRGWNTDLQFISFCPHVARSSLTPECCTAFRRKLLSKGKAAQHTDNRRVSLVQGGIERRG